MRIRDEDEGVEVQMTSFMDCAFLLLIFFLVTAIMKKPHKEVAMDLAPAAHAQPAIAGDFTVRVVIPADLEDRRTGEVRHAQVVVEEQAVTDGGLEDKLRAEYESLRRRAPNRKPGILLAADKRVRYERLLYVLDLCQFVGYADVRMQTGEKSGQAGASPYRGEKKGAPPP
jgi:biopolymer transport protein ExbD